MNLSELTHLTIGLPNSRMESSPYMWSCFPDAAYQDIFNQFGELSIVFSQTDGFKVYELIVSPVNVPDANPYRWIDPEYRQQYLDECKERDVNPDLIYDNVRYIDIEIKQDILEKAEAIMKGLPYDSRVMMDLDISDELFMQVAKLAHEKDITFNQMVAEILTEVIEREKLNATV